MARLSFVYSLLTIVVLVPFANGDVTIVVVAENGKPLENFEVIVQTDPARKNIAPAGKTDAKGVFVHQNVPTKDDKDYCVKVNPPPTLRREFEDPTVNFENVKDGMTLKVTVKIRRVPVPAKEP